MGVFVFDRLDHKVAICLFYDCTWYEIVAESETCSQVQGFWWVVVSVEVARTTEHISSRWREDQHGIWMYCMANKRLLWRHTNISVHVFLGVLSCLYTSIVLAIIMSFSLSPSLMDGSTVDYLLQLNDSGSNAADTRVFVQLSAVKALSACENARGDISRLANGGLNAMRD